MMVNFIVGFPVFVIFCNKHLEREEFLVKAEIKEDDEEGEDSSNSFIVEAVLGSVTFCCGSGSPDPYL
jgi:hypothetical protein